MNEIWIKSLKESKTFRNHKLIKTKLKLIFRMNFKFNHLLTLILWTPKKHLIPQLLPLLPNSWSLPKLISLGTNRKVFKRYKSLKGLNSYKLYKKERPKFQFKIKLLSNKGTLKRQLYQLIESRLFRLNNRLRAKAQVGFNKHNQLLQLNAWSSIWEI